MRIINNLISDSFIRKKAIRQANNHNQIEADKDDYVNNLDVQWMNVGDKCKYTTYYDMWYVICNWSIVRSENNPVQKRLILQIGMVTK